MKLKVLKKTFPIGNERAFVFAIGFGFLAIAVSTGKSSAYAILLDTNKENIVTLTFKDSSISQDSLKSPREYKLLGMTTQFVIVLELDNSSVYSIAADDVHLIKREIYPFDGDFKQNWKDDSFKEDDLSQ